MPEVPLTARIAAALRQSPPTLRQRRGHDTLKPKPRPRSIQWNENTHFSER